MTAITTTITITNSANNPENFSNPLFTQIFIGLMLIIGIITLFYFLFKGVFFLFGNDFDAYLENILQKINKSINK